MKHLVRPLIVLGLVASSASAQVIKPGGGFVPPTRLGGQLPTGCTVGQTLTWNGTVWACSTDGGGDITAVTAGAGMTGGGTSGAVTLNVIGATGGGLSVLADSVGLITTCASGQMLRWLGTAWGCGSIVDDGTHVGIGLAVPTQLLHVSLTGAQTGTDAIPVYLDEYVQAAPSIAFRRALGSAISPTSLTAPGQFIAQLRGEPYTTTGFVGQAGLPQVFLEYASAESGAPTAAAQGTYLGLRTVPIGAANSTMGLKVDASQNVGLGQFDASSVPARLTVVSVDVGSGSGTAGTAWDNKWSTFGPSTNNTTGAGLGLGYSSTDDNAVIASSRPGTAFKPLKIYATTTAMSAAATADGGLRLFDIAGPGLTSSANTVSLAINGGSTQTCASDKAVTALTSAGITTCSFFYDSAGTGLSTGATSNVVKLADTAVTPGTYTHTTLTIDQQGRITAASSGTAGTVTSITCSTGLNCTASNPITASGTITLANTAVSPASYTYASITVDQQGRLTAASSGTAPLTAANLSGTTNTLLKITGTNTGGNSSETDDGTTFKSGTLFAVTTASGNLAINTNKFTVAGPTGNTVIAGTADVAGNFAVNTDQFTVNASDGSTNINATLTVGGATLLGANLHVGAGADTAAATGTTAIFTLAGTTSISVRDSTNNVEAFVEAISTGVIVGSQTNHSLKLRTNNTDAITISTTQGVTFAGTTDTTAGTLTAGTVTTAALTVGSTQKFRYGGPVEDSGTQYTVASCGTGSSQKTQGGATSGTVTIGPTGTGCTITMGSGTGFAHNATCWVSARGATKGHTYTTGTGTLTISNVTAGDVLDWGCESTP